jgi:hypothetical protein
LAGFWPGTAAHCVEAVTQPTNSKGEHNILNRIMTIALRQSATRLQYKQGLMMGKLQKSVTLTLRLKPEGKAVAAKCQHCSLSNYINYLIMKAAKNNQTATWLPSFIAGQLPSLFVIVCFKAMTHGAYLSA